MKKFGETKPKGSSDFFRVTDQEQIVVFRDGVSEYYKIYGDQTYTRYSTHVAGSSWKFCSCVIVPNGDTFSAKLLEGSGPLFSAIQEYTSDHGFDYVYSIKKIGEKLKPQYIIKPKKALEKDLSGIELPALPEANDEGFPEMPDDLPPSNEEIPF